MKGGYRRGARESHVRSSARELESWLARDQPLLQHSLQRVAHAVDLLAGHPAEERQGDRAGGDMLAHRQIAGLGVETIHHVRLKVDRREVVASADTVGAQVADDLVAIARV